VSGRSRWSVCASSERPRIWTRDSTWDQAGEAEALFISLKCEFILAAFIQLFLQLLFGSCRQKILDLEGLAALFVITMDLREQAGDESGRTHVPADSVEEKTIEFSRSAVKIFAAAKAELDARGIPEFG